MLLILNLTSIKSLFKILSLLGGDTISSPNSILGEIHTVGGRSYAVSFSSYFSKELFKFRDGGCIIIEVCSYGGRG